MHIHWLKCSLKFANFLGVMQKNERRCLFVIYYVKCTAQTTTLVHFMKILLCQILLFTAKLKRYTNQMGGPRLSIYTWM